MSEHLFPSLTALGLAVLILAAATPIRDAVRGYRSNAVAALVADDQGYARALDVRDFEFPRDHAAHPEYRTEWWYLTGNMFTPEGRRFGYQVTIFRSALAPPDNANNSTDAGASGWRTRQVYFAHVAVSDIESGTFLHDERFERGAMGLAGASQGRTWIGDWTIQGDPHLGCRLLVTTDTFQLNFNLAPGSGHVLRGDRGLSAKSHEPGNNSYYYAFPRMPTIGSITLGDVEHAVTGLSWYDREWSTSALTRSQVGWDWFAIHGDDGTDLMVFQLRREEGTSDFATAALTRADGSQLPFTADQVTLSPLRHWTSQHSGSRYPIQWRLQIPAIGIDSVVMASMANQEHTGSFRYWEGAVDAIGSYNGVGYLEMTGY